MLLGCLRHCFSVNVCYTGLNVMCCYMGFNNCVMCYNLLLLVIL